MSLRVTEYIRELRIRANKLENTDINNNEAQGFLNRNQRKLICAIPATIIVCLLPKGVTDSFVAYMSDSLSILIGLFTTAIIFGFDKFYQPRDLKNASSNAKLIDKQSYNYTKQFVYITSYSIVLCLGTLILLAICALCPEVTGVNIKEYYWCVNNINCETIRNFLYILLVVLQRYLIFYWLLSIVYYTLFAIGSLVKFMVLKID